jgi:ATP-dependent Clp protease ATP-binding subunit ClpA
MYERFTDRARKVMQLANQEAMRFNHEYIGTEHVLLGLVKEGSGVASHVLKNLDVDLRKVRLEVEKQIQSGPDMITMGKLPQTPRTKKIIEYSIEEARGLNHNYVGTEHILLGLIREEEGVAGSVLTSLGVETEDLREEVLNLLGHGKNNQREAPDAYSMLKTELEVEREAAISNQDFELAAQIRDQIKKNTSGKHKEALRQIACVLLGHIKEDYGTEITLQAIKKILDEGGI